jgi:hypothetical protein
MSLAGAVIFWAMGIAFILIGGIKFNGYGEVTFYVFAVIFLFMGIKDLGEEVRI